MSRLIRIALLAAVIATSISLPVNAAPPQPRLVVACSTPSCVKVNDSGSRAVYTGKMSGKVPASAHFYLVPEVFNLKTKSWQPACDCEAVEPVVRRRSTQGTIRWEVKAGLSPAGIRKLHPGKRIRYHGWCIRKGTLDNARACHSGSVEITKKLD